MDIYKVRRGRFTNVRIWSYVDLGTCRKTDIVITNERNEVIQDYAPTIINFDSTTEEEQRVIHDLLEELSQETETGIDDLVKVQEEVSVEKITVEENEKKGLWGDLL